MKPHEWMIKPTYQTEWIDRKGIFLWLALYAGGLGGGLYLVSLYFNNLIGMLVSLLIVAVLKGGFHLAFLGKPLRFWRIISRPNNSWLARGFILVILFIGFATIQIIVSYFLPGSFLELLLKILAGLTAFGVAIYTGFVLNTVKTISFWNSKLLPMLFIICGILGGFGLAVLIALFGGNIDITTAEHGSRLLLAVNALLIIAYLWFAAKRNLNGKQSVSDLLRGKASLAFWIGVIVLGIVVPLMIAALSHPGAEYATELITAGVICEIIGGLSLRYCILKVGIYTSLFPMPNYLKQ